MSRRILLAALLVSSFLVPAAADALPRYASREGATCNTCHVDPNGGGIRNDFGFTYLKNRHGTDAEERWASVTIDPKLNEWITIGLDTRILYVASHVTGGPTVSSSTFFPMQGQVNVAVMPHSNLTLVASHGLVVDQPGFPAGYVARELYGMFEGLPARLYARVGRFRVPFGLRQDDHTSYVRAFPFLPYDSQKPDAGIEIGQIGSRWTGQASFTNGTTPFLERAQTVAGKVGYASDLFQAGVSGFHRYAEGASSRHDRWALYASTTLGELTLLGEYGAGTSETPFGTGNLEALWAEADYRLSRALNLRLKYDGLDLNRRRPGAWSARYAAEIDVTPVPFSEIRLAYRYYDDEGSSNSQEYLAMFFFPF